MSKKGKSRRSNTQIIALIITAIVALSMVVTLLLSISPREEAPTATGRYESIISNITDDGLPILGDPEAPVTIVEISDFTCSHCMSFHDTTFVELLDNYIRGGQANMVFVPSISNRLGSEQAIRASLCALEQAKFWEMHDILFGMRGGFNEDLLIEAAETLGLDVPTYKTCWFSEATEERLAAADERINERRRDGTFSGTPALYVNGVFQGNWANTPAAVGTALGGQ